MTDQFPWSYWVCHIQVHLYPRPRKQHHDLSCMTHALTQFVSASFLAKPIHFKFLIYVWTYCNELSLIQAICNYDHGHFLWDTRTYLKVTLLLDYKPETSKRPVHLRCQIVQIISNYMHLQRKNKYHPSYLTEAKLAWSWNFQKLMIGKFGDLWRMFLGLGCPNNIVD